MNETTMLMVEVLSGSIDNDIDASFKRRLIHLIPTLVAAILGLSGNLVTIAVAVRQMSFRVIRNRVHEIYLSELACLDMVLLIFWLSDTVIQQIQIDSKWWTAGITKNLNNITTFNVHCPLGQSYENTASTIKSCHIITFVVRLVIELRTWLMLAFLIQRCCQQWQQRQIQHMGAVGTTFLLHQHQPPRMNESSLILSGSRSPRFFAPAVQHGNIGPVLSSVYDRTAIASRTAGAAGVACGVGRATANVRGGGRGGGGGGTGFTMQTAVSNLIVFVMMCAILLIKNTYTIMYLNRQNQIGVYVSRDESEYECIFTTNVLMTDTKNASTASADQDGTTNDFTAIKSASAINDAIGTLLPYILSMCCALRMMGTLIINSETWSKRQQRSHLKQVAEKGRRAGKGALSNSQVQNRGVRRRTRMRINRQRSLTVLLIAITYLLTYSFYAIQFTTLPYILPKATYLAIRKNFRTIAMKMIQLNHCILFYVCIVTDRHFRFDVGQILCFCFCFVRCCNICCGGDETEGNGAWNVRGWKSQAAGWRGARGLPVRKNIPRNQGSVAIFYRQWQDIAKSNTDQHGHSNFPSIADPWYSRLNSGQGWKLSETATSVRSPSCLLQPLPSIHTIDVGSCQTQTNSIGSGAEQINQQQVAPFQQQPFNQMSYQPEQVPTRNMCVRKTSLDIFLHRSIC